MLIALLLALTIALSAIPIASQMYINKVIDQESAVAGNQLAGFSIGVQNFIAAAQNNPAIIPASPIIGSNWLKPPSCGGLAANPVKGYIPCSFPSYGPNDTLFNGVYQTYITNNAGTIDARTTFLVQFLGNNHEASTIAAKIANSALGSTASAGSITGNNTFFNATSNADYASNFSGVIPFGSPNFGRVTAIASNNPSQSIFLRVDGTNQMLAALNMNNNDLINARDIQAYGRALIGGDGIFGGGVVAQGSVASGADISAQNNINAGKKINAGTDIVAGRNIVAGGDVVASSVTNSDGSKPSLTRGVYSASMVSGPASIAKPVCSSGQSPQIFAALQSSATSGGDAIDGIDLQVSDAGGSWNINPVLHVLHLSMTAATVSSPSYLVKSWSNESPSNAKIIVFTKCN